MALESSRERVTEKGMALAANMSTNVWSKRLSSGRGRCSCSGSTQVTGNSSSPRPGVACARPSTSSKQVVVGKKARRFQQLHHVAKAEASEASREAGEAKSTAATAGLGGTPVKRTSLLVVGATGTLGRQVVRRALDDGYEVRCLVRARENPADFLRDWGAIVVNGDLLKPETLPPALVGVHTVIDCATGRPEESVKKVDWEGKVALIQTCQAMKIQKYVFFSIFNCDKHPNVPLMNIKLSTEKFLEESGLDYTVIRLCGFMQAVISQYAVPILEEKSVYGTDDQTKVAYMDSTDVARLTLAALKQDDAGELKKRVLTFAGPQAFTIQQVIGLCERYAGADAKVTKVPMWWLTATRVLTSFFQWTVDVTDRMAFAEVLTSNESFVAPMEETYAELGVDPNQTTTLEMYLQDYYSKVLKRLKEVGAESRQGDYYL